MENPDLPTNYTDLRSHHAGRSSSPGVFILGIVLLVTGVVYSVVILALNIKYRHLR